MLKQRRGFVIVWQSMNRTSSPYFGYDYAFVIAESGNRGTGLVMAIHRFVCFFPPGKDLGDVSSATLLFKFLRRG